MCSSTCFVFLLIFFVGANGCPREPSYYQSKVGKTPGDNGYQIKIDENPSKYMPGKVYTLYLMGSLRRGRVQKYRRFTLNVEATNEPDNLSPQRVGSFQLFRDSLAKFNEECVNTVSEVNATQKSEVFVMWAAPPPGSGCVTFRSMIFENSTHWYADDGLLSKTFCEQTDKDATHDENDCCACDEAKYSMIFEGLWSNITHPKDFPFSLWLTHFSDVIGASHERNFSFWGEGQISSEGFRSLAEWGSVRLMETELRAKSKFLRTLIKANGLWYPNVNTNTSANFKVDRRHHLISLASMLGPSPDWVVGVTGLNLCLKNCSWMDNLILDLYPYDAGTDSGISYMSPNAETNPRERIYRITTTYPEDPRAPFYDPSKTEMPPLARLYLTREKLLPKNCDESFLTAQVDFSENTEEVSRPECAVGEYTNWSECSVSCGKGLRMRTREYRLPQKAKMFNCNRQLVSKEMCVADIAECGTSNVGSAEDSIEELPILTGSSGGSICETSPWSPWSECSQTCGIGFKMRTRFFVDKMGSKKCPHVSTVEKEKCMGPVCRNVEIPDPECPTTEWSDWSACSATCGEGTRVRLRFLLVDDYQKEKCTARVRLSEHSPCSGPDCHLDMATAKSVCMEKSEAGPCQGNFNRWYFESKKMMCVPFEYGGCRGNRNNFLTSEECMESCRVVRDILKGGGPSNDGVNVHSNPSATLYDTKVNNQNGNNAETRENPHGHYLDCVLSDWSRWSPCSVSCGSGYKEKFRTIERHAIIGGKPCPRRLVKKVKCYGPPCI